MSYHWEDTDNLASIAKSLKSIAETLKKLYEPEPIMLGEPEPTIVPEDIHLCIPESLWSCCKWNAKKFYDADKNEWIVMLSTNNKELADLVYNVMGEKE